MYYAGLASAEAEAAAKSRDSIGAAEDNCSKSAEAAKVSEEAAAQSAARFDDSDSNHAIEASDFVSLIASSGTRYRKLVKDVADEIIKKIALTDMAGKKQSVQAAVNGINGSLTDTKNVLEAYRALQDAREGVKWKEDNRNGVTFYYYEGRNTTEYGIPTPHCFVMKMMTRNSRGAARAYEWNNGATASWICSLHDDDGKMNWHDWTKIS